MYAGTLPNVREGRKQLQGLLGARVLVAGWREFYGAYDGLGSCIRHLRLSVLSRHRNQRRLPLPRAGVLLQIDPLPGNNAGRAILALPCAVDTGAAADGQL